MFISVICSFTSLHQIPFICLMFKVSRQSFFIHSYSYSCDILLSKNSVTDYISMNYC